MSKRILILTGSPRRGGNSDLMADAFAKGASEAGNSVVQFNTAHKHIQGCRACDNCFSKEWKIQCTLRPKTGRVWGGVRGES